MPLVIVAASVVVLLVLVLRLRLQAFVALLLTSAAAGLALGMDPAAVLESVRQGMASTLGFIAVVVGLGAIFGAILEAAGGVRAIADALLERLGSRLSTWALSLTGFLVAIPVFFDVALVILAPLIRRLAGQSGRTVLYFATPLLGGLVIAHAFVPPTPGPIAVAELLGADLGWVIGMGVLCGLPAMVIAGPLLAGLMGSIRTRPVAAIDEPGDGPVRIGAGSAVFAIVLPLVLIVGNTAGRTVLPEGGLRQALEFVGHPFVALLIACLYAYVLFGLRAGMDTRRLQEIMTQALEPAGIVVLVTGAGGVFKQVLIDSGVGEMLGETLSRHALPPMLLAFILAGVIRICQGSATVAMITSAGLMAPILEHFTLNDAHEALIVIAIASGATLASHVNDSGFWLVNRYLNLTEGETLRSWTVISTVAGLVGFIVASLVAVLIPPG